MCNYFKIMEKIKKFFKSLTSKTIDTSIDSQINKINDSNKSNIINSTVRNNKFTKIENSNDDSDNYKITSRVIMIGDFKVGKSSLINNLIYNSFNNEYKTTLGLEFINFGLKSSHSNYKIRIQLWDVGGDIRYCTIAASYIRGSVVIIMMFDLSSKQSFLNIDKWYKNLYLENNEIPIILVGNKCDIEVKVTETEIESYCNQHNFIYCQVSIKNDIGIEKLLNLLGEKSMDKLDTHK